jgi:ketosteroid isomerase-like protein
VDVVLRLYRHPNADLARWARDDSRWTATREPGGAQFHPDFESVRVGAPGASRYRGWDGYRAFWLDWLAPWETYRVTVDDAIEVGDRVVVFVRAFATFAGSDTEVNVIAATVYTVRDGQITRIEFYDTRAEAVEAVGLAVSKANVENLQDSGDGPALKEDQ